MITTLDILKNAKKSAPELLMASTEEKNKALLFMADALMDNMEKILKANAEDMEKAKGSISTVMLDRLMLNEKRISDMAKGIREVAELDDPVGRVIKSTTRADGLIIQKISVPMGVIAIIYESRPNVTSDAAALCLKSGNACILRVGKEAFLSAQAITDAMREGIEKAGISPDVVQLIQDTTHKSANELMTAVGYVDLLIPRGGVNLIKACVENATVNCIQTGTGICHVYVDKDADIDKALNIIENAKTSRPSVCNAEEVCVVNSQIAEKFLPLLKKRLVDDRKANNLTPVELRLDERTAKIIDGVKAGENDFDTEFLDYILAVKIVDTPQEAIKHISLHSTGHSDAIITENEKTADLFVKSIDSAAVYVNASTRFTDGGEFGLGCEMGISTQKLHARGPMGLEELNTYKYVIKGNGHTR